jgi:hypothetical protein
MEPINRTGYISGYIAQPIGYVAKWLVAIDLRPIDSCTSTIDGSGRHGVRRPRRRRRQPCNNTCHTFISHLIEGPFQEARSFPFNIFLRP